MPEKPTLRIGYVPEHYLAPLHLSLRSLTYTSPTFPYTLEPVAFPSGTGHMITSLRAGEIDLAIGLTEGWVAGIAGKSAPTTESEAGYKIVGHWVDTPLRWAIVTGRDRSDLKGVDDLRGGKVGVSRLGSGSHVMSFVLADEQKWEGVGGGLEPVILGPFGSLKEGVTGTSAGQTSEQGKADFFMWEHFTTKPSFTGEAAPLKKIGEIFTPWPSWMVVASTSAFPNPESDDRLDKLFALLDEGIKAFQGDHEGVVKMLGTGEFGCHYSAEDGAEWIRDVRFSEGTRGVSGDVLGGVVDVLKGAGVIGEGVDRDEAVKRVTGISR
ncbi:hypothetical protein BJX68DRAFT_277190 [Aspergillus pseudodeflectus]|uniref:Ca3427-like PBP 2 domain-containing protein n=1 Tax=Aspergillus pseudodeflectus TaxID=176178 RepID=A0ABR4K0W0_9EURO